MKIITNKINCVQKCVIKQKYNLIHTTYNVYNLFEM